MRSCHVIILPQILNNKNSADRKGSIDRLSFLLLRSYMPLLACNSRQRRLASNAWRSSRFCMHHHVQGVDLCVTPPGHEPSEWFLGTLCVWTNERSRNRVSFLFVVCAWWQMGTGKEQRESCVWACQNNLPLLYFSILLLCYSQLAGVLYSPHMGIGGRWGEAFVIFGFWQQLVATTDNCKQQHRHLTLQLWIGLWGPLAPWWC